MGAKKRGHREDGIYFDHEGEACRDARYHQRCHGRWRGAISLGFGPDGKRIRRKVSGKTKTEVTEALKALHAELDRGVRTSPTYTVRMAVGDWLEGGLPGRSDRTLEIYREATAPLLALIGSRPLRELTARDVRTGLEALAERVSTRYLQIARQSLVRAIRQAEAQDLVARNVASLVDTPKGQAGRRSRSLTLEQTRGLLATAQALKSRLFAYLVLSVMAGLRTEEARALRWAEVDLDTGTVAVIRAVRHGGDTKTLKSRRMLMLPRIATDALRQLQAAQHRDRLIAGEAWQEHGLVFCTSLGTQLDDANVRREFRKVADAAGLGPGWAPRDLRHTFVSLMSEDGVPVEEIARLVGHDRSTTTEVVYRHELRPVIRTCAEVMDRLFDGGTFESRPAGSRKAS
jgi:integrase